VTSGRPPGLVLAVLLAAAVSLDACKHSASAPDAGKDAKADTKSDGGAGPPEVSPDVLPEASPEVAPDAPAEVAEDAAVDVADVSQDAPVDADPACQTIAVDATRTVHLRITADNECDVFVNGADVGSTTSWPSPVTIDVSLFIYPGRVNVIAVVARNTSSQGGNDRGIIGELDDLSDGGSVPVIVTDGTWRTAKGSPDGTEQSGWPALLFDDGAWVPATVVANHGDAPWGALLGTSNAQWLWSAPVPADTANKPDLETAYFRKKFYFASDGTTLVTTPGCPVVAP
jgi:hypothetical protein